MTKAAHLRRLVLTLAAALALPVAGAVAHDGGVVDAGTTATVQPLTVTVRLDATAHATPRVWNFLVEDAGGRLVDSLEVRTTRDQPAGSATSRPLGNGDYVVRIVAGNHIAAACYGGIFYRIVSPPGGVAAVALEGAPANVDFAFAPCPDNPGELGVEYAADPRPDAGLSGPGAAGGTTAAVPGPPATGTGLAAPDGSTRQTALLAFVALAAGLSLTVVASLLRMIKR